MVECGVVRFDMVRQQWSERGEFQSGKVENAVTNQRETRICL